MPTYEYKCRACGHRFEAVQSFSDEPLKECGECGGELGKVFGSIGITFKGSGFYRTDSRSSSTVKADNGKEKKKESTSDSSSSSKSDSKSESKSDSSKKPAPTGSGAKSSSSEK